MDSEKKKRKVEIVLSRATAGDVEELLQNIRDVDIQELNASTGKTPEEVMKITMEMPGFMQALRVKGELVCIFGIVSPNQNDPLDYGIPWMLGTDKIKKYKREFLDASKMVFCTTCGKYRYLENYVDERNMDSIKWLAWLGFYVGEPEAYGVFELPFRKFFLVNNYV